MTIAEQVQEIVEETCKDYCKWPDLYDEGMEDCELSESSICKNCPLNRLEYVKPKTGHWIDHQEGRWIYAQCSKCGTVHDTQTNYCPNCGCRMVEPQESEVHYTCTDAEIAKSFIEDVDAVKDLLPRVESEEV